MKWYSMFKLKGCFLCICYYRKWWLWCILQQLMCVVNVRSITNGIIKYTIQEELPTNTLIGDISRDSGITEKYSQDIIKQLKFKIITNPVYNSLKDNLFNVDDNSGLLKTAVKIDRDVICPRKQRCSQAVEIVISPNQYFQIISIQVDILDTNDNVPKFDVDYITVRVSESVEIGHVVTSLPAAKDPDSGVFGITKYRLQNINKSKRISDTFYLEKHRKLDGSLELKIILASKLDRENVSSYQFEVIAFEGTKTPQFSSLLLNVTVLDANDNLPIFRKRSYSIDVPENTTIKYPIVSVSAYDPDIGSNGRIIFGFSRKTTEDFNTIFDIGSVSGEIYMKGILDYEFKNIYSLVVTATNESPDSQSSEVSLIVNVKDINDFTPQITVLNGDTKQATVLEQEPNGTVIAYISVVDMDSGKNGKVICDLNTNDFEMKQLKKDRYTIISNTILNREVQDSYQISLTCSDKGNPALSSSKFIMVKVLDINDHAPYFEKTFYTATVEENNEINLFILQVSASDEDIDQNAFIKFSLSSNNSKEINQLFQIDDNGILRAQEVLDHEKYTSVSFEIIAQDNGNPVLTATARVLIEILDVNDCKPTFSEQSYHLKVYENQLPGSIVGNVSATDSDSYPNNIITYSIESSEMFTVNAFTGIVTTKAALDREELEIYHLKIISINPGTPEIQSIVRMAILVMDENDNIPVIDFPNSFSNKVDIYNNVKPGYSVTLIKAHDYDRGINAKLIYTLQERNNDRSLNNFKVENGSSCLFSINQSTGEIKIKNDLKPKSYNITIVVKDSGSPQQTTTSLLTINVKAIEGRSALLPRDISYNIDGDYESASGITDRNVRPDMSVVIAVACGITLAVVGLILGILFLSCRRQERHKIQRRKYDAQAETQIMLNKDTGNDKRNRDKLVPTETKIKQLNADASQMSEQRESSPRYTSVKHQVTQREIKTLNAKRNDGMSSQSQYHLHTNIASSHEQNQFSTRLVPLTDKEVEIHKILKFLQSQDEDIISPSDSGQFTSSIVDDTEKSNGFKGNKETNIVVSSSMTTFGVVSVKKDLVSAHTRTNKGYKETSFEDDENITRFNKHRGELTGLRNKHCCNDAQKATHFYNIPSEQNQAQQPCYGIMRSVSRDDNFPPVPAPYVCSSSDHSIAASDMSGSYVMRQDDEVIKLDLTGLKDTTV